MSYSVLSFYSSLSQSGSLHPMIDLRFHKEKKETLENVQNIVVDDNFLEGEKMNWNLS